MFVACRSSNGKIIGFCELEGREKKNKTTGRWEPRPYMCNLAVNKKWRRCGVAQELVKAAEEKATNDWNMDKMYLRVKSGNAAAVSLYCKLGYEMGKGEETKIYHPFLDTNKHTEIKIMSKLLFTNNTTTTVEEETEEAAEMDEAKELEEVAALTMV
eukprot:CAMPEP_0118723062 /NCGR_PEP_ID=MMETSP0800-20121206/31781_1 /TAXON_ID=210618 ORGANISM="Striatella unipunctata, Strain CCMP2910" /NCGR_SAMPLE_ID=MMETSP0800 /ASSEMBLY_ACC=CAM_ASM_000638 /LENGTH=156 /DNA_ID=CAMNT_0006631419 /DNA_START=129 /DNA_END=599 /DNA_ORIENTATION=+